MLMARYLMLFDADAPCYATLMFSPARRRCICYLPLRRHAMPRFRR